MAVLIDTVAEYARGSLTRPSDFGTIDENAFTSHGAVYSVHRDSDALERTNWQVFIEKMQEVCGEDYGDTAYVMHCGHWAVGWLDHLLVKVYESDGSYTPAFLVAAELLSRIEDYPCLDDDLMSEIEWKEDHPRNGECYSQYCKDEGRCAENGKIVDPYE